MFMYRVNVLDGGKHNNVSGGYRYCFFKRSMKKLVKLFEDEFGCEIEVERLGHVGNCFFWDTVEYWNEED